MHECLNGPPVKIGSRQHHLLYYFAQMWRWETRTAASAGRIANIHGVLHHLKALKVFLHLLRLWQKLWWCMSCGAWRCTLSNCFGYKIHRYIEYVTAKRMVSLTFIVGTTYSFCSASTRHVCVVLPGIVSTVMRSRVFVVVVVFLLFFLHCHTKVYQLLRTKFQHWLYKLRPSSPSQIKAGGWKRAH